jgi:mannose-6-phosphate isomerase-like protein (cupin superfamily)
MRFVILNPASNSKRHSRAEEEVIMVHSGQLTLHFDEGDVDLGPGDVFTVPIGKTRSFSNNSTDLAEAYIVRGGDQPAPARILD